MEVWHSLAHPAHRVHLGLQDVQEIPDKDLQDHLGPQASQVMEDQDLKETKGTPALYPVLVQPYIQDHQGLLGLPGLKDQQVLKGPGDTKVNLVSQVCPAPQEHQEPTRECQHMLEDVGSQDHRAHQGLQGLKDSKGTLELLGFQALQEAQSQSPQVLLVLQVLLALQACRAPLLLLLRCGSTSVTI